MALIKKIFLDRNNIIIFFFLFIILNYIFFNYRILSRENGYILGDWVINYSSGFVKRGFLGHIFYSLSINFNISIINIVFVFSTGIYLLTINFFYKIIKDRLNNNYIFIFILLPSTFLFNFFDPLTVGRKEVLVFFFFSYYYLYFNEINLFIKYKIITLIFFIVIILTHEIIFFLIPYLFVLKYLQNNPDNKFQLKDYLLEILIFIIGIIIIFVIFKTSHLHDNDALCNSLLNVNLSTNSCWAINDFKNKVVFNSILPYFLEKNYFINYAIYFFLTSIPLVILIVKSQNKKIKKNFIIFSLLSLTFSTSFFFLVNDWGRYLNIIFLLQFLLILSFTKQDKNESVNNRYNIFYLIKLSLIFIYLTNWHMPHCCNPQLGKGFKSIYDRISFRLIDNSNESTKYKDLPRVYLRKIFKID